MHQIRFALDREYIALDDLLKLTGVSDSGGAAKALVASGAVQVDGAPELRKTRKLRPGARVRVGGVEILVHAPG